MDAAEAAVKVLREEDRPLHWTVIQDLALRRGYMDPFTDPQVKKRLLSALASLVRQGVLDKVEVGVYAIHNVEAAER